jgi:hypothetical protein
MSNTSCSDNDVLLHHRSYVLRCLPVGRTEAALGHWRFTIEEAEPDSTRMAFSDLEGLIRYLSAEFESPSMSENNCSG